MNLIDRLDFTLSTLDHFCCLAAWYSRQRKVRRGLVRYPWIAWRDIARCAMGHARRERDWHTFKRRLRRAGSMIEKLDLIAAECDRIGWSLKGVQP